MYRETRQCLSGFSGRVPETALWDWLGWVMGWWLMLLGCIGAVLDVLLCCSGRGQAPRCWLCAGWRCGLAVYVGWGCGVAVLQQRWVAWCCKRLCEIGGIVGVVGVVRC